MPSIIARRLFALLSLLLASGLGQVSAQKLSPRLAVPPDSLRAAEQTTDLYADSLGRRFDEDRVRLSLQRYTRRKTLAGRAVSAFFRLTRPREEDHGLDAVLLNRQFDQHNFKVVRHVTITPYDAFGYSLNDSLRQPRSFLERSGNALHIRTARSRIRQVLLFRPGQPLLPQALAESERLLRQTDEILDARVLVNEATATRDSVDILVYTTDVFSITAGYEPRTASEGIITAGDQNFLGLGHQLNNRYQYGRDEPQTWGYEGNYQVPFRNFVYAQGHYFNEFESHSGGVAVQRDFYSPSARWAGAITMDAFNLRVVLPRDLPTAEGVPPNFQIRSFTSQSVWVGRALRLRSYDLGYENPGRLIIAGSVLHENHTTNPYNTPDDRTRTLMLGTVGYSVRRYYKDKYLFGFGRTEDVPAGLLMSFTTGFEMNAVGPRRYFDAKVAAAGYSVRQGYLYGALDFGTFQRVSDGGWEQGLLNGQFLYFTRRYRQGNYQSRHLLSARATVGFNRYPSEVLLGGITGNAGGVRGFRPEGQILATSRFLANYEGTLYTPLSLLGFRMAVLAFADAAFVSERVGGGSPFGSNLPYTGFGVGLRFRNELTVLRTFQLLIGYYPRGQLTPNGLRLFETNRDSYQFSDFSFGQPSVVRFDTQ
ncbi:hypothetical protein GO988_16635 [Hymenobacter sp. HMF4947]|uniref:Bacterial surface antigen (D15) domain-containing protein n=1 Tax=Hymenobacter ginkgonis TaxID=2682976 RepID=A0A7K1THS1_9BACT|nr:hypothetical protein [Hymenobacter ginkgonis]MVN77958.1 hypothetical protein [Hymenobacter ginkgonis]